MKAAAERDRATYDRVQNRWVLWLGIGNAGGTVFVVSHMVADLTARAAYLLLPSAWLFALGLLAIGASVWTDVRHGQLMRRAWDNRDFDGDAAPPPPKITDLLGPMSGALEVVAVLLFCAGVLYPLAVVSIRYLCAGSLAP